jgi:hypothetical protein
VAAARVEVIPCGQPPGGSRVGPLPHTVPAVRLPRAVVRLLLHCCHGWRDGDRRGGHGGEGLQEDEGVLGTPRVRAS